MRLGGRQSKHPFRSEHGRDVCHRRVGTAALASRLDCPLVTSAAEQDPVEALDLAVGLSAAGSPAPTANWPPDEQADALSCRWRVIQLRHLGQQLGSGPAGDCGARADLWPQRR